MNIFNFGRSSTSTLHRLRTPNCDTKPPCAVIVTICEGGSYDDLYRTVEQTSPSPDHSVALFEASFTDLELISSGNRSNPIVSEVVGAIALVEPQSVVFNFECCGGCRGSSCWQRSVITESSTMQFLKWALQQKHVVMFGDFSLMALISNWSEKVLGPNPFVDIGTCDTEMTLKFNPETLLACPNAQLQNVGRMCNEGTSILHAMSGTIVYTVNPFKSDTPAYKLTVLTLATAHQSLSLQSAAYPAVTVGEYSGTAGHVMLEYPSGGVIFASAGHWIELNRIDANEEGVLQAARLQLGEEYYSELQENLRSARDDEERDMYIQRSCQRVVQSSAPCSYSYAPAT
jgi:hypothetical protein